MNIHCEKRKRERELFFYRRRENVYMRETEIQSEKAVLLERGM